MVEAQNVTDEICMTLTVTVQQLIFPSDERLNSLQIRGNACNHFRAVTLGIHHRANADDSSPAVLTALLCTSAVTFKKRQLFDPSFF